MDVNTQSDQDEENQQVFCIFWEEKEQQSAGVLITN